MYVSRNYFAIGSITQSRFWLSTHQKGSTMTDDCECCLPETDDDELAAVKRCRKCDGLVYIGIRKPFPRSVIECCDQYSFSRDKLGRLYCSICNRLWIPNQ